MKKLLLLSIALLPNLSHAFSSIRYVQISTNTLGNQTGAFNVSSGTATNFNVTNSTMTNATLTNVSISSMTSTLPMSGRKITGLANGTATSDAAAFGQLKVVQEVTATLSTSSGTTSTTFVPIGLSATITPLSASNKILVLVNGNFNLTSTSVNLRAFATLTRNGSDLGASGNQGFQTVANVISSASSAMIYPIFIIYPDSPASTSALTYAVQIRVDASSLSATWGQSGNGTNLTTSITLLELVP